jgi:hypothetical protein
VSLSRRIAIKGPPQTVYLRLGIENESAPFEVTEAGTTIEKVLTW